MPEISVAEDVWAGQTPHIAGLGSSSLSSSGTESSVNIRLKASATVLSVPQMCVTENLNADKRTTHLAMCPVVRGLASTQLRAWQSVSSSKCTCSMYIRNFSVPTIPPEPQAQHRVFPSLGSKCMRCTGNSMMTFGGVLKQQRTERYRRCVHLEDKMPRKVRHHEHRRRHNSTL